MGVAGANIVGYATGYDFLYTNGMPIRYIALPFPVAGQPKSVHHQYIFDGKDQVSGKPTMQAIVDALTKPLTDKEVMKGLPPDGVCFALVMAASCSGVSCGPGISCNSPRVTKGLPPDGVCFAPLMAAS